MYTFASTASERNANMFTTALVTNNNDPEGLGRIKLQYPWSSDTNESYWARVVTAMSGDAFGSYFLPEVGDEVLVAFLNGDVDSPMVIGSLWNQNHLPPESNSDDKNNIRTVKSRSGHEIRFDDNDEGASQKLEIKSSKGHSVIFDDTSGSEKITLKDSAGGSIELDAVSNKITIKSNTEIAMEAPMITIKADSILTLKGGLVKIN